MTSTTGVQPAPESVPTPPAVVVPDAQTAGLAATAGISTQMAASSTTIGSLADLKNKAPQVYNAMMQGLAETIINTWQQQEKDREAIDHQFDDLNE